MSQKIRPVALAAAGAALVGVAIASWACGSPAQARPAVPRRPPPAEALGLPAASLVTIPGGTFVMGDAEGDANEAPRQATVVVFRIMRYEVTNRQFARFVTETGHVTDPEKRGFGWVWKNRRWSRVSGAVWRHPHGPDSSIEGKDDAAVVQISARDAAAFCAHYGLRLPTDPEWERAARGDDGGRFPWGDDDPYGPAQRGNFGTERCCAPDPGDGHDRIAPVGQYPAGVSPYGLFDMAGNVWEWTSSPFPGRPGRVSLRGGGWGNNTYCLRVSYRHSNPPDRGLDLVGFRCAADAEGSPTAAAVAGYRGRGQFFGRLWRRF